MNRSKIEFTDHFVQNKKLSIQKYWRRFDVVVGVVSGVLFVGVEDKEKDHQTQT